MRQSAFHPWIAAALLGALGACGSSERVSTPFGCSYVKPEGWTELPREPERPGIMLLRDAEERDFGNRIQIQSFEIREGTLEDHWKSFRMVSWGTAKEATTERTKVAGREALRARGWSSDGQGGRTLHAAWIIQRTPKRLLIVDGRSTGADSDKRIALFEDFVDDLELED